MRNDAGGPAGQCPIAQPLRKQAKPVIDILADLILGKPISFLDFAFELVTPPIDGDKLVVGGRRADVGGLHR